MLALSESLNNLAILIVLPIAANSLGRGGIHAAMEVLAIGLTIGVGLTALDLRRAASQKA